MFRLAGLRAYAAVLLSFAAVAAFVVDAPPAARAADAEAKTENAGDPGGDADVDAAANANAEANTAGNDEAPAFPDGFVALPNDPYVAVNRAAGEVMIAASLSDGMTTTQAQLEFLLISGQRNLDGYVMYERAYEAVFTTRARPDPVFLACLLAGFRPGDPPRPVPAEGVMDNSGRVEGKEVAREGEAVAAERVTISLRWPTDNGMREAPVEAFLFDQATQKHPAPTPWLFTGSYLVTHPQRGQTLAASFTQVLAATYYDRSALFNLPYFSANTYETDSDGLILDAESLPDDFRRRATVVEGTTRRTIQLPAVRPVFLHIRKATEAERENEAARGNE